MNSTRSLVKLAFWTSEYRYKQIVIPQSKKILISTEITKPFVHIDFIYHDNTGRSLPQPLPPPTTTTTPSINDSSSLTRYLNLSGRPFYFNKWNTTKDPRVEITGNFVPAISTVIADLNRWEEAESIPAIPTTEKSSISSSSYAFAAGDGFGYGFDYGGGD